MQINFTIDSQIWPHIILPPAHPALLVSLSASPEKLEALDRKSMLEKRSSRDGDVKLNMCAVI
jgi:hypothetical protein